MTGPVGAPSKPIARSSQRMPLGNRDQGWSKGVPILPHDID